MAFAAITTVVGASAQTHPVATISNPNGRQRDVHTAGRRARGRQSSDHDPIKVHGRALAGLGIAIKLLMHLFHHPKKR